MTLMAALMFVLQSAAPFEQPQQTQNAKASIEGFVVRAGTNEPIARARVTVSRTAGPGGAPLQPQGPPQTTPPVTTDGPEFHTIRKSGGMFWSARRRCFQELQNVFWGSGISYRTSLRAHRRAGQGRREAKWKHVR